MRSDQQSDLRRKSECAQACRQATRPREREALGKPPSNTYDHCRRLGRVGYGGQVKKGQCLKAAMMRRDGSDGSLASSDFGRFGWRHYIIA
jgi:hypothetical protein